MPRALELFSGTGSVGKVLREHGWEVVSVDCLQKFNPTICTDVGTWDYTANLSPNEFDYVHLSPPCTEYSRALTTRPRRLEEGDRLALKALEILDFLQPRHWTIENPDALLKTRPFMHHLHAYMKRVTYCTYADGDARWSYKKPTCIWTNLPWTPRTPCCKAHPCEWLHGRGLLHPRSAQKAPSSKPELRDKNEHKREELYGMPPGLVGEWVRAMGTEGVGG